MRLITMPISHYCERARWSLEHAGLRYTEEQHLQVFHAPYTQRAARSKTVPVLITADGEVLTDSAEIVEYADQHASADRKLYSSEPGLREDALALEREYAEFGVESRRVMYFHFLRWGRGALAYNAGRAPRHERWAMYLGFPLASRFLRRYLNVNQATMELGLELVNRTFDEVAERLAEGRQFLVGDRFGAADLTFACMAAAVISPSQYGTRLPTLAECPEDVAKMLRHFRNHPAGQFALSMFQSHRHRAG